MELHVSLNLKTNLYILASLVVQDHKDLLDLKEKLMRLHYNTLLHAFPVSKPHVQKHR